MPLEARLLLLTERVNWAAKTVSPEYYALKQHMFAEAAIYGADKGVELLHRHEGKENNWNLYHPAVGVISVHDPYHEIAPLLENKHVTRSQRAYPWSGVYREDESQRLLEDPAALRAMAQQTAPAFSTAAPIKTSLGAAHALHPRQKTAHLQLAGAGAVVGA